jgi:hypothetical protein
MAGEVQYSAMTAAIRIAWAAKNMSDWGRKRDIRVTPV